MDTEGQTSFEEHTAMAADERALVAAREVTSALAGALGDDLSAVYLHGSAVLGGFRWASSDLDVLALSRHALTDAAIAAVPKRLSTLEYPANGLELSLMTEAEAHALRTPSPRFQLHVATDGCDRSLRVVDGRQREGDPDLVLHIAVCRAAAVTLLGRPATEGLGILPDKAVRRAVASEVRWSLQHEPPEQYVVLTAARAWHYCATGEVASKLEAGEWVQGQGRGSPAVAAALALQRGSEAELGRPDADAFARSVLALLDRE